MIPRRGAAHLWAHEHSSVRAATEVRWHRARLLAPRIPHALVVSEVDLLAQVADCLPRAEALIVWESALRRGLVTRHQLERVRWAGREARALAAVASGDSDSLLETLLLHRLRALQLHVRQQVPLLGHRVDFLVGERLVVQADGYAFHSSAPQRAADLRHDARLLLDGYSVLRFGYADIVEDVERIVAVVLAAVTQGLAAAPAAIRRSRTRQAPPAGARG